MFSTVIPTPAKWLGGLVVVALVVAGAVMLTNQKSSGKVAGASTGYQAVFLTNGQVYFGKLTSQDNEWMKLTDIYYLQVTQNLQQASGDPTKEPTSTGAAQTSANNIQLVKLGSELHGPDDMMYIEQDKVLFWENMKSDSKVSNAIKQYQDKH